MAPRNEWAPPASDAALLWRLRFEDADRARISAERWIRAMGVMGCTATLAAAIRQDVLGLEVRVAETRANWIEWNSWQGIAQYVGLTLLAVVFARSWWVK